MSLKSIIPLIFLALFASCGRNVVNKNDSDLHAGVKYARRFSIERYPGHTDVSIIDPWQGASGVIQVYHFVKRGDPIPAGIDSSSVVFTPVHSLICMSTTHIAMAEALGETMTVKGVSGADFIYSPAVRENIKDRQTLDVGYESNLNKEMILGIAPELIMIYGIGGESSGYMGKLRELGMKVMINADYLEADPLGRAEWIKLFGILFSKEKLADSLFNDIELKYNNIKAEVKEKAASHPKVLLGLPFKDTWYISPGNSYTSRLISDAGGEYLWKDTESKVSMPMSLENVYLKAIDADFWLNAGTMNSLDEIKNIDPRLAELPCFRKTSVYNNNKRVSAGGGNDFWESGILSPHVILKDIVTILHPGISSSDSLVYYKRLN